MSAEVVILSSSAVLSAGITAALATLGWSPLQVAPEGLTHWWQSLDSPESKLIAIADETGALPDLSQSVGVDTQVIVVGGRCAARSLLKAVQDGAVCVIDGDQPLQVVTRALDRALRRKLSEPRPSASAALARQLQESDRIASLTKRELQVLEALTLGLTAADIGRRNFLSMPTVRSHIRAVLHKLDVSSQLAAVAVHHRSRCKLVNFDDSQTVNPPSQ